MRYCGPKGIPLDEFLSWPQTSQDAALEWQAHEQRRCGQCGYHPEEHPTGVHAHVDVCPGCAARAKGEKAATAADDGAAVRLATGSLGTCQRCITEHQANVNHPPPRSRHSPGH
ncbi:hypothetical protein GCM10027067_26360 [Pseudactinotalea suaedae]